VRKDITLRKKEIKMNEQEVKDNEEYERLTPLAQELYNMIKNSDSKVLIEENDKRYSHEDIMDILYGYVNMEIWRNKND
jgi:septal ring factor EnvC (AmiA/AmiB activator)